MNKIAIITDIHGMKEPLEKVLEDIKNNDITEIYSLGDNVCLGIDSHEVINILRNNNVKSIMGNSEEYIIHGHKYFPYFKEDKINSLNWVKERLTKEDIEEIKNYKHTIELNILNKKICLCHFINDVRIDYSDKHSSHHFLRHPSTKYFGYTNSNHEKEEVLKNKDSNPLYMSYYNDPLFNGKKYTNYDYIFEGHVHFKSLLKHNSTTIYTLDALAVGRPSHKKEYASYIIVTIDNEVKIEEKFVKYDYETMIERIKKSDIPDKNTLLKYLNSK